jgi:hypothetical protein
MVASLPVFVKVAVPQLAMKIAATEGKTFRERGIKFIWRFLVADVAATRPDLSRLEEKAA